VAAGNSKRFSPSGEIGVFARGLHKPQAIRNVLQFVKSMKKDA
jgi:hypothetical protein